jgi:hypothetical protein
MRIERMAADSTATSRSYRRIGTGIAIISLVVLGFGPIGRLIEQTLSPVWFAIWIVIVFPALPLVLFAFNSYMNIREDRELTEAKTEEAKTEGA